MSGLAGFTALGFLDTGFLCPVGTTTNGGGGGGGWGDPEYDARAKGSRARGKRLRETLESVLNPPQPPADTLPGVEAEAVDPTAVVDAYMARMLEADAQQRAMLEAQRAYIAALHADDEDILLLIA